MAGSPKSMAKLQPLPQAFDLDVYRALWPDLAGLDDDALAMHYAKFGINEGRRANELKARTDLVKFMPQGAELLEIGPFYSPLLPVAKGYFFDVMSRDQLVDRAKALGVAEPNVPDIDFVSPIGDLSIIERKFDAVISSHCLEHQPDLVAHLNQVERLLRPSGRYFVLIPDKRYCFDHFMAPTTIADVLDAHDARRTSHRLKSVIEHRALTTHNDAMRHWAGDHGSVAAHKATYISDAIAEYEAAKGGYIDVHAWYFTPDNIVDLLGSLNELNYTKLVIERLYPTRRDANEFWMVLTT